MLAVTFSVALSKVPSEALIGVHAPASMRYSAEEIVELPVAVSSTVAVSVTVSAPAVGLGVAFTLDERGPVISGSPSVAKLQV